MLGELQRRDGRSAVLRILTGTIFGQGVFLAVSPILTRIYSPEDFSALALVTAFVSVLGSLVTMSWERAVVLPDSRADASVIVWLGLYSSAFLSSVVGIVSFLSRNAYTTLLGAPVLTMYWWIVPVTTFIVGVYAVLSSWVVRYQRYGVLAARNASVGVGQAVASVGLGVIGVVPLGLLSSLGIGRLVSLPGLIAGRDGFRGRPPSFSQMSQQASTYRKFPLVASWSRTLNSLGLQLPLVLLIGFFGSYEAGFVALTMRVLAAPIGLVVDAVSQYFEGVFSASVRTKQPLLTRLVLTISRSLLWVGVGPAIVVLPFGTGLFGLVFGNDWAQAGSIARILVPVYLLQLVVVPVSRALLILQCQGTQLAWDCFRVAVTSGAVAGAFVLGAGITATVAAFAIAQTASYVVLFWIVMRKVVRWDGKLSHSSS